MEQAGLSFERVLAGSGVTPADLEDKHLLLDIPSYIRIVNNINQLYPSPNLVIDLGQGLRLSDLGVLGYAMMSSASGYDALRVWDRFNFLFFGNLVGQKLWTKGHARVYIEYQPAKELTGDLLRFFIEEKLAIAGGIIRILGFQEPPIKLLSVTYNKPNNLELYENAVRSCASIFRKPKLIGVEF